MNAKQQKILTIIISILVLLFIGLTVMKKMNPSKETMTEEQIVKLQQESLKEQEVRELNDMLERDRIEYYFSKFLNSIELKKYEEAYNMLNSEFKENYFKTQKDFETYVSTHFPKEVAVDYENIERNGNLYVLWITMGNAVSINKDSAIEMNVVIKENAVADFELSFSVEQES